MPAGAPDVSPRRPDRVGRVLRAVAVLTFVSGAYLVALTFQYFRGSEGARRHNLEAASFILVALLTCTAAARWRAVPQRQPPPDRRAFIVAAVIAVASAVWLYAPVISSGLFADDFVLLEAARQGRWTVWSDLFRPTIFITWRLLDRVVDDPSPLLHLTNILLHGINAWLVFALATRFNLTSVGGAIAAALFLSFPASVEAVVWPAGFQDVGMTTLVLTFLMVATRQRQTRGSVIAGVSVLVLACVTKETGVVAPFLAMLVLLAGPNRNWRVVTASAVTVAAFLSVRFAMLPLTTGSWWVTSRYGLKESLVRPFASLVAPFRASDMQTQPIVVWLLVTLLVVSLCAAAGARNRDDDRLRVALLLSAFVLGSIAPLFSIFVVTADLHGSRYLYLGSVAWALLLARVYGGWPNRGAAVGRACAAVTLVAWVVAARAHQGPWLAGAELRQRVLTALDVVPSDCSRSAVYGLPKVVDGVPIFLNGFLEAARERRPGYVVRFEPRDREHGECHLTWDGAHMRRE